MFGALVYEVLWLKQMNYSLAIICDHPFSGTGS